jgi:RNA recognition motif-containing protein
MAAIAAPPVLNPGAPMEGVVPSLSAVSMAPSSSVPSVAMNGTTNAEPEVPSVPPSETLYIQNLNEKIRPEVMKQTLRSLFKNYGEVLDVVAHQNMRMRGQAFVSFADKETAEKAQREVHKFPLYSKAIVSHHLHFLFSKVHDNSSARALRSKSLSPKHPPMQYSRSSLLKTLKRTRRGE